MKVFRLSTKEEIILDAVSQRLGIDSEIFLRRLLYSQFNYLQGRLKDYNNSLSSCVLDDLCEEYGFVDKPGAN